MHKQDIAAKIARKTDLDERSSREVLNLVLAEIADGLRRKKRVTLTGFGTFEIRKHKKRSAHNIANGEIMTIPAHKVVGFVASAPLKRLIK